MVAGGGFYSYYVHHKGINQIKKEKLQEKIKVLCIQKDLIHFLKDWCNSTSSFQTFFYLFSGVVDTNAYIIGENPNKDVDIQVGTFN